MILAGEEDGVTLPGVIPRPADFLIGEHLRQQVVELRQGVDGESTDGDVRQEDLIRLAPGDAVVQIRSRVIISVPDPGGNLGGVSDQEDERGRHRPGPVRVLDVGLDLRRRPADLVRRDVGDVEAPARLAGQHLGQKRIIGEFRSGDHQETDRDPRVVGRRGRVGRQPMDDGVEEGRTEPLPLGRGHRHGPRSEIDPDLRAIEYPQHLARWIVLHRVDFEQRQPVLADRADFAQAGYRGWREAGSAIGGDVERERRLRSVAVPHRLQRKQRRRERNLAELGGFDREAPRGSAGKFDQKPRPRKTRGAEFGTGPEAGEIHRRVDRAARGDGIDDQNRKRELQLDRGLGGGVALPSLGLDGAGGGDQGKTGDAEADDPIETEAATHGDGPPFGVPQAIAVDTRRNSPTPHRPQGEDRTPRCLGQPSSAGRGVSRLE